MIKKFLMWYLRKHKHTIKVGNNYIVMMDSNRYDNFLMKVCS